MASTSNASDADVILESSDETQFKVHKHILSDASSVFEAMFDLPPETSNVAEGSLPIIPVTESTLVLDQLLRFCYPSLHGSVSDLHTLHLLFTAADKHDMKGVTSQLAYILRWQFTDKEPRRAYAIACMFSLWPEAKLAGRLTLSHPVPGPSLQEYDLLPASMYHKLVVYRQKCIDVIDPILEDWMDELGMDGDPWIGYDCGKCVKPNGAMSPSQVFWFYDHLARTKAAFVAKPTGASVSATKISDETVSRYCRRKAPMRLVEFGERLAVVLDQKVSEIPLILE
ncbi:hypothetical protein BDY19DRAFT_930878 [Irpex rosettiformis]|uniref:Uncharacterized protein n=1 Tax=Irpex rosettiformis TaxID=378272 RepID=A0ACB8UB58_9APHY|nr:hypothetical protein BDY19DRAFT_930878 [Irpex rosettiformis]